MLQRLAYWFKAYCMSTVDKVNFNRWFLEQPPLCLSASALACLLFFTLRSQDNPVKVYLIQSVQNSPETSHLTQSTIHAYKGLCDCHVSPSLGPYFLLFSSSSPCQSYPRILWPCQVLSGLRDCIFYLCLRMLFPLTNISLP